MKIVAFTYLFLLFSCSMFAQENNGTQYDINDPRNPNCPCHKYQKAADEEYQRELNKQKVFVQVTKVGSSTVNVIDASTDIVIRDKEIKEHEEIEEVEIESKSELKTKKTATHRIKHKRVKTTKHKAPKKKKFKFGKKDNSRCTHW